MLGSMVHCNVNISANYTLDFILESSMEHIFKYLIASDIVRL